MKRNIVKYILILTLSLFTAGLISGAISLFYIPDDFANQLTENFEITLKTPKPYIELFKSNFSSEIIWVIIIWLLGNMRFTAPLSVGVVGIRGFFLGFGSSFILAFCEEKKLLLFSCILPQALFAISALTLLVTISIRNFAERVDIGRAETGRLVLGAAFFLVAAVVSALEAGFAILFINM